jgi:hypothetical protein
MRPTKNDYPDYAQKYLDLIEGDDIIFILHQSSKELTDVINSFPESKGDYSYDKDKWTVKQVIGHLMDTDRIFAYRALSIARGEKQPLPSFDQNIYVLNGNFNKKSLAELSYEYRLLRESNLLLFRSFDSLIYQNRGIAAGSEVTVLGIMFMVAGHQKHHIKILKEKYL